MRYVRPSYYDAFRCAADACPSTCCEGWQIVIDAQSLKRYRDYTGDFGRRMQGCVSWEEGVFRQRDGRCAMLDDSGLCDLIREKGEEALCETCRQYPRHVEEFENVREYSLSLSCPVAARMILEETGPFSLLTEDTPEEECFEEGFDLLLYTRLADAREVLFALLQKRELPFEKRGEICLAFAGDLQECLEAGDYSGMDEEIRRMQEAAEKPGISGQTDLIRPAKDRWMRRSPGHKQRERERRLLCSLERLDPAWDDLMADERRFLSSCSGEEYRELRGAFLEKTGLDERLPEKLAVFFIYTYFCGAVYDDSIHGKVLLALFSADWILELLMARRYLYGEEPDGAAFVRMAYRWAREVEHSDENLLALEDYFWDLTHPGQ
ncbi:flagellin lysine-N-methylase [Mordavella massiliensis]|uniref:Flagellin lysine-N-methylase n=1 Tax=Mordavella massiliensis TaxID=1871024 RepID=A0A938XAV5_9CLOT|nr:flagellin lysine-N-methylase [Mordavella massiliensis]MBM6948138.1 flagellin lysine-N-methylase [Mordavella massiliensis]